MGLSDYELIFTGFEVIRDLVVVIGQWNVAENLPSLGWLQQPAEVSTMQGDIGLMEPNVATALHSITDFGSSALLQASSDAVPHANGYLGPAVLASVWERNDQDFNFFS